MRKTIRNPPVVLPSNRSGIPQGWYGSRAVDSHHCDQGGSRAAPRAHIWWRRVVGKRVNENPTVVRPYAAIPDSQELVADQSRGSVSPGDLPTRDCHCDLNVLLVRMVRRRLIHSQHLRMPIRGPIPERSLNGVSEGAPPLVQLLASLRSQALHRCRVKKFEEEFRIRIQLKRLFVESFREVNCVLKPTAGKGPGKTVLRQYSPHGHAAQDDPQSTEKVLVCTAVWCVQRRINTRRQTTPNTLASTPPPKNIPLRLASPALILLRSSSSMERTFSSSSVFRSPLAFPGARVVHHPQAPGSPRNAREPCPVCERVKSSGRHRVDSEGMDAKTNTTDVRSHHSCGTRVYCPMWGVCPWHTSRT